MSITAPFFTPVISRLMADLPFAKYQSMPGVNASLLKESTAHEMYERLSGMLKLPVEAQRLIEYKGGDAADIMSMVAEAAPRTVPRNFIVKGDTEINPKATAKQKELVSALTDKPVDARDFHPATLNKCCTEGWAKIVVKETPEHGASEQVKASRAYALAVGDATHKAILEPHMFDADTWHLHWQLSPTKSLVSESALAAFAEDPTRTLITPEIIDIARRCRDAVWKHKEAARLLNEPGKSEVSMQVWDQEMGVIRKARFDRLPDNRQAGIVDVKTTHSSLLTHPFKSAVYSYGYHTQGGFYVDTESMLTLKEPRPAYYIIAVRNEAPYMARVFELLGSVPEDSLIVKGRDIYQERLATFVLAHHENYWAGYEDEAPVILTA